MWTRDLGRMLRGEATPAQMMGAAVLGGLLGFVPGFWNGAGLCVALGAALLILNVSLPFALLAAAAGKLAGLLLLPVSFQVGQWLLDGPTQPLFRAAINAPVLALFGFEHYATTGGLVLGLLFGLALGTLCVRLVARLRSTLAGLDAGSPRYQAAVGRWYVKLLAWALVGTKDVRWSEPPKRRRTLRLAGLVVVLVAFGLAAALHAALTGPLLTGAVRRGLELANGATVDLKMAELDLTTGRLTLLGLALADPNALDRDLFRAERLQADVDAADLLRKRLALDDVVVSEARQGALRDSPGQRTGGWEPSPAPEPAEGDRTLEDYVRTAEEWKARLQQVRRWLEALSGGPAEEPAAPGWEDELERRADQLGYASVTAEHLVQGAPTFLVRHLSIEGLVSEGLPGEILDVTGEHLSTQPALVAEPARLRVVARSGLLEAQAGLGGGASTDKGALLFRLQDFPVDRFAAALSVGGEPPLSGGTRDLVLDGGWAGGQVGQLDLPVKVSLHDTTLRLHGKSQPVKAFHLQIGLHGPLDDPSLRIDDDGLAAALKDAGAAELSRRVDEKQAEVLDDAQKKLDDELKDKLGGLLGGSKDEPKAGTGKKKKGKDP